MLEYNKSVGVTAKLSVSAAGAAALATVTFLLYLASETVNQSSFYVGTAGAVAAIYFVASLGLLMLGTILTVAERFISLRESKDSASSLKSWKINLVSFLLGNIIASIITHIRFA